MDHSRVDSKPQVKDVSSEVKSDTDTFEVGSQEVHDILEAKGLHVFALIWIYMYSKVIKPCIHFTHQIHTHTLLDCPVLRTFTKIVVNIILVLVGIDVYCYSNCKLCNLILANWPKCQSILLSQLTAIPMYYPCTVTVARLIITETMVPIEGIN